MDSSHARARWQLHPQGAATSGFDLDAAIDEEFTEPARDSSPLSLEDVDLVIRTADVLPSGIEVKTMGAREYSYLAPGIPEPIRMTIDADYYEQHADSVELWSAGNPIFPTVELLASSEVTPSEVSMRKLLAGRLSSAPNK